MVEGRSSACLGRAYEGDTEAGGAEADCTAASLRRTFRSAFNSSFVGRRTGASAGHGLLWKVTVPLKTHLCTAFAPCTSCDSTSSVKLIARRWR